jgi:hypothetical protein
MRALRLDDGDIGVVMRDTIVENLLDVSPGIFLSVEGSGKRIKIDCDDDINALTLHDVPFVGFITMTVSYANLMRTAIAIGMMNPVIHEIPVLSGEPTLLVSCDPTQQTLYFLVAILLQPLRSRMLSQSSQ